MHLYVASYAALIVLLTLAIVGFANQNRIGAKLVSGYVYLRQHLYLLVVSLVSIALWAMLLYQDGRSTLIIFAWVPLNLFVTPSSLGEKGLKAGIRFIPRERLVGYSLEADRGSRAKVQFKVEGMRQPVVMQVYPKHAVDLEQKLAQYFEARDAN